MSVLRRSGVKALVVVGGVALIAAVFAVVLLCLLGSSSVPRAMRGMILRSRPKAVVDEATCDLGVIEFGREFTHVFVIRNEGTAPLQVKPGASSCKCLVAQLPALPIPPGGQAEVRVGPTEAAKAEELKSGPIGRAVQILTNDAEHASIALKLKATVERRLAAACSPLSLIIHAADLASQSKRSAETVIYSQVWDTFALAAIRTSRSGVQWRIDRATADLLKDLHARSGYRLTVTLPPDLPDGRFAEWVDLEASPQENHAAAEGGALRLEIQGRVEGRVTFHGRKVLAGKVLRLGTLATGEGACERLLMKIHDEQRSLAVQEVDTQPPFLRVQVAPPPGGLQAAGFYQIQVEVPDDAPPCAFTGNHPAVVRLKTNHPRLSTIELPVDFAVLSRPRDVHYVNAR